MAELAKKLHLKKGTTEHLAKAYSTTAEAGAEYITNKIDGVTAYVPIGATNDSRATVGRVKKSGSAEKAILMMGKPPYTEKSWTTAGTYTFTVPQGVTRIRVAVCGGGSGSLSWKRLEEDTVLQREDSIYLFDKHRDATIIASLGYVSAIRHLL